MASQALFLFIREDIQASLFQFLLVFGMALAFYLVQRKVKYVFPFAVFASALIAFSFFGQRFEEHIHYALPYFVGFSIFMASFMAVVQKKKFREFALLLAAFFFLLSPAVLSPQIRTGDDGAHFFILHQLHSRDITPEALGESNYLNISPLYYYFFVSIAKITGTGLSEMFFAMKLVVSALIFLSFFLIGRHFSNTKFGILAALLAFFPVASLHLAPQILGRLFLLNVFIYTYLKFFHSLRSRIILLLLIVSIVYVNLTTLYISLSVFAALAGIYFVKSLRKKFLYFTDFAVLALFILLTAGYFYSVNIDIFSAVPSFLTPVEEGFDPSAFGGEAEGGQIKSLPAEDPVSYAFLRVKNFVLGYVNAFSLLHLITYVYYYALVVLMVLIVSRKMNREDLGYYALGFIVLIFFLILIGFQQGVHATLWTLNIVFLLSIIIILAKREYLLVPLVLFMLCFNVMPVHYSENQFQQAQGELNNEFRGLAEFEGRLTSYYPIKGHQEITGHLGDGNAFIALSCSKGKYFDAKLYFPDHGEVVLGCTKEGKPFVNGLNASRERIIYENEFSTTYAVDLKKFT